VGIDPWSHGTEVAGPSHVGGPTKLNNMSHEEIVLLLFFF